MAFMLQAVRTRMNTGLQTPGEPSPLQKQYLARSNLDSNSRDNEDETMGLAPAVSIEMIISVAIKDKRKTAADTQEARSRKLWL